MVTTFGFYCGNMTGKNLPVTGDQVKILFKSDGKVEQRGYQLLFSLVSPACALPHGKWDHKEAD